MQLYHKHQRTPRGFRVMGAEEKLKEAPTAARRRWAERIPQLRAASQLLNFHVGQF